VLRNTITGVLAKTEPVAAKADKDDDKDEDEKGKTKSGRRAAGGA